VLSAYSVFLLLLRLWLAFRRRRNSGSSNSPLDWLPDTGIPGGFDSGARAAADVAGRVPFSGAGDFSGGGAGGGWTGGDGVSAAGGDFGGGSSSVTNYVPDMPDVGLDLDLGDGCFWIVIPIAAIVGVIFLMFYVVYVAPLFLAEILVDALLVAGLYKRLKGIEEPRHWLRSVVRRTLLPAMLAAALFIAAGYLMERIAPEARSIGGFWREINSSEDER
jgi:hypothetical protein